LLQAVDRVDQLVAEAQAAQLLEPQLLSAVQHIHL
jgi:hypothetical protein